MKGLSPTQRTLKYIRSRGYFAEITEHWNQYAFRRVDLLGFCDVLALDASGKQKGALAIQTTSGSGHAARRTKILGLPAALLWLKSGNCIVIISWSKRGARGEVKRWTPKIEKILQSHFHGKQTGQYPIPSTDNVGSERRK